MTFGTFLLFMALADVLAVVIAWTIFTPREL